MIAKTPMPQPVSPALRLIVDLEAVLHDLLIEHRKLMKHVESQQAAMKEMNLKAMETSRVMQDAARVRVIGLEQRRKSLVQQIARVNQLSGEPRIPELAKLYPQRATALLKLRGELHAVMTEIAGKSYVASKVAAAVLGHLNTAMRIVSAAVGGGGVYTNKGVPRVSGRIGVMEAVG